MIFTHLFYNIFKYFIVHIYNHYNLLIVLKNIKIKFIHYYYLVLFYYIIY